MKKLLIILTAILLLIPSLCFAWGRPSPWEHNPATDASDLDGDAKIDGDLEVTGSVSAGITDLGTCTVATLPVAATYDNYYITITDGASATDVSVGGGTTQVLARSDGASWATVGGSSLFETIEKSADAFTLTAAECSGTLVTTRGWDGADDQTGTLPDADTVVGAGLKVKFLMAVTDADNDFYIDTEGSTTKIYLDGTALADGFRIKLENPTIGESIVGHTATLDGTTYDWFFDSINGLWTTAGS